MILCVENPKDKKPDRKIEFSKVAGQKVSTQKSVAMEQPEQKIPKTISFTIALKRIKYLIINLTTEVKDLHNENYKTLLKEMK